MPTIFDPDPTVDPVTSGKALSPDHWQDNPWAVTNFTEFLMFNCPECEFKTKEEVKLMSHGLQTHTNAKEYFKTNPTIYDQKNHPLKIVVLPSHLSQLNQMNPESNKKQIDRLRETEEARTCKHCSHVSPTWAEHKDHFRKCNHALNYYCQDCEYNATAKESLRKHCHLVHGKMQPGTIICDLCGHVSYSEPLDRKHKLKAHSDKPTKADKVVEKVMCDVCGKYLRNENVLKNHKEMTHQRIELRTCKFCQKVFANIAEVYKHHQDEHPNDPCSIIKDNVHVCECQICFKILSSHHALYTHYKLTHKLQGKEMNQYHSGYNPNIRDAMKLQLEAAGISVEEESQNKANTVVVFKCDNCDRRFGSLSFRETHMKVCNERPKTRKIGKTVHKCDYCDKAFQFLGSLKRHLTVCLEKPKE